jgi:hypothetical protein
MIDTAVDLSPVLAIYTRHLGGQTAITPHLPRLRRLAEGLDLAVEFGVKRGASSSALLLAAQHVISYDIVETVEARELQAVAGTRWSYRIEDSRRATFDWCDLLFIDSLHTYGQVHDELEAHASKVKRYLVFHDTLTFGSVGAKGESGDQLWTYQRGVSVPPEALGIRPAIDELMMGGDWHLQAHYLNSHGLLVLERR